ncbi:phosphoribosylformimino-5-aminoimidazole carboxamide ribotide isomerase [Desulfitispora alkaliphila]|uniref:1-(5-phosphoribosyl)-5-[(5- phosphoribosylamino)methylideneamino]imidazole-4- carboxamide isomerase n=1 Tax=Desulfitispora alkaliphila TaxID=622674 RepID=UPI003D25F316
MLIIPAIDLRAGKCVRLIQGDLKQETIFSDNPVAVAKAWEAKGAKYIHLVDLDGAFAGFPKNLDIIKEITKAVSVPVQVGGGIRSIETIEQILSAGVDRVILGTVAIGNPNLVKEACSHFGEKIVVGIDSKDGLVAIEGWEATVEKTAVELAIEMKELGIERVIFTDTRRDGTLKGPNLESTKELAQEAGIKVIASGGVANLQDLVNLKKLEQYGVEGVVMGKALYTEAIDLEEALRIADGVE